MNIDELARLQAATFQQGESVPFDTFWQFCVCALFISDPSRTRDRKWPVRFYCADVDCQSSAVHTITHIDIDRYGAEVSDTPACRLPCPPNWRALDLRGTFPDAYSTPHYLCDRCSGGKLKHRLLVLIAEQKGAKRVGVKELEQKILEIAYEDVKIKKKE